MLNWSDPIKRLERHLEFEVLLSNEIVIKEPVSQKGFRPLIKCPQILQNVETGWERKPE